MPEANYSMNEQDRYINRCLELAQLGLGLVAPNPMVGCVIMYADKIIGEGYHFKYGEAHAEVNAIQSVKDKSLLKNASLYVNLEPCAHHGKTPPCVDLIIAHQIPEIVIGCIDTFAKVAGKGLEKLKQAGCKVTVGVLEKEARFLNRRFFTFHEKKRPYILLKWAQTLDGFIDGLRAETDPLRPNWITSQAAQIAVHKWRSEESAILVGTRTALNDNPQLTVRLWDGKNPIRVLIDRTLRIPRHYKLFDQSVQTLVFTEKNKLTEDNVEYIQIDFSSYVVQQVLNELYKRNIQSVIIEGGAATLDTFIENNLWDEARVFIGNKTFGKGLRAPILTQHLHSLEKIGEDQLLTYFNR